MSVITQVNLLKYRRTKIIATLGPASDSPEKIKQLIEAGVNVFRLNMSHGDHETHTRAYNNIREISRTIARPIAVLVDLCGPKIRVGKFLGGKITLVNGESVIITMADVEGKPGLIPSQYPELICDVVQGSNILLDDGALELEVVSISDEGIHCKVIQGGVLKNHKGINLPGSAMSAPALTEKDKKDAAFALRLGADFIALSFVRNASDIEQLRALIKQEGGQAEIIAKMEKPQALANAEQILDAADGIMIARGDLGVELPPEQVPVAQDQLITLAREKMKPVIVATQMLESMISRSKPTRAEVTDVSYAVNSGADAVMLSAETASGVFPVEAVKIMDRIARQAESHLWKKGVWGSALYAVKSFPSIPDIISHTTATMSKELKAHGVFVISKSRKSSIAVSAARPAAPIVAITNSESDYRCFALLWGIIPLLDKDAKTVNPIDLTRRFAVELGLAKEGNSVLLVRGFNEDPKLNTPSITVITV